MHELSALGREEVCKLLGINDKKSIFIKSREAFNDRMKILRVMCNTDKIIETYLEEMQNFDSEEEYVEFLNESRGILESDILKRIVVCVKLIEDCEGKDKFYQLRNTMNFITDISTGCTLRIWLDSPLYEGLKYIVYGLYNLPNDFSDYVEEVSGSKFLALAKDIDDFDIGKYGLEFLRQSAVNLSFSIFNTLSPMYLNKKEAKYIGESEVLYETSENKTLESIQRIKDALVLDDELRLSNVNIELVHYKELAKNSNMCIKQNVLSGKQDNYDVYNYNSLELIAYLRMLYNERPSKYDKYFMFNGKEAKLSDNIEMEWIERME
jgi:hypothetical protein